MTVTAPQGDVAILTQVEVSRNYAGFNFPAMLYEGLERFVVERVKQSVEYSAYSGAFDYIDTDTVDDDDKKALYKSIIMMPKPDAERALKNALLSKGRTQLISINSGDHINIVSVLTGAQVERCGKMSMDLVEVLEKNNDMAFDEELGYLTSSPERMGTGMSAQVLVHLPGLVTTKKLKDTEKKLGENGTGLFKIGRPDERTTLFILKNKLSIGMDEEDIIENVASSLNTLVEDERAARFDSAMKDRILLKDALMRSLGIIKYCELMNPIEGMFHVLNLRYAACMGFIDIPLSLCDRLTAYIYGLIINKTSEKKSDREKAEDTALILKNELAEHI